MEGILRGQEIFNLIPFDMNQGVLFFPVRHHSPACSYHLMRIISEYKPDCILVEGPENANDLIPLLTDPKAKPPMAFYYYYKDKQKLISEEEEDFKCYYPFLSCSPEYNALMEARRLLIHSSFIDLPYGEILINTSENRGLRMGEDKSSYNDDYYLFRGDFFERLCEKTGLRSFDEFWEKYFEINGIYESSEDFVAKVMTYCHIIRQSTPLQEMREDGCLAREQYMAANIKKAKKKYSRILVVTGGFHTPGLYDLLQEKGQEKDMKPIKVHAFSKDIQNAYVMAYSLEAADALNGYGSGMQGPGFYDKVWQRLKERQNSTEKAPLKDLYRDVAIDMLLKAANAATKHHCPVTMADISSAVNVFDGLANLRDKREPGLYELYDSVQSCFIKGELNASTDEPLKQLKILVTGDEVGSLGDNKILPPIVLDFYERCKSLGIKYESILPVDIELEIFKKKKHLETSRFFCSLEFLDLGFAHRIKGADIINNRDRSRTRESWRYRWTSSLMAGLYDHSIEGTTILEAAKSIAYKRVMKERSCSQGAKLYVQCFLMGLDMGESFDAHLKEIINEDSDFFSLGKGIYYFSMLLELRELYSCEGYDTSEYMKNSYHKLIIMLPSMASIGEDREQEAMDICKTLSSIATEPVLIEERKLLTEAFESLLKKEKKNPALQGTVLGLLYGSNKKYKKAIDSALEGYLKGTLEIRKQGAKFLHGLFFAARDIALTGEDFITMTDKLISEMDMESFMEVLPELRLAFGYFTPGEIDNIAERVADINNSDKESIKKNFRVDKEVYLFGSKLDREIMEELNEYQGK